MIPEDMWAKGVTEVELSHEAVRALAEMLKTTGADKSMVFEPVTHSNKAAVQKESWGGYQEIHLLLKASPPVVASCVISLPGDGFQR